MIFKNHISGILTYFLLLPIYAPCIVNGTEEQQLVAHRDDNIGKTNIVSFDKNEMEEEIDHTECYICKTTDNVYINHVMGVKKGEPTNKTMAQCVKCGKLMHSSCFNTFSKKAANEYRGQLPPSMIHMLSEGERKLCPCCMKSNSKNQDNDNKANQNEEGKKQDENKDKITISKEGLYIGLGAIVWTTLILNRDNKVEVHVNSEKA